MHDAKVDWLCCFDDHTFEGSENDLSNIWAPDEALALVCGGGKDVLVHYRVQRVASETRACADASDFFKDTRVRGAHTSAVLCCPGPNASSEGAPNYESDPLEMVGQRLLSTIQCTCAQHVLCCVESLLSCRPPSSEWFCGRSTKSFPECRRASRP